MRMFKRIFMLIVVLPLLLIALASCTPANYSMSRIIITVEYIGTWSGTLKHGAAADNINGSGNMTYPFGEEEGPFVVTVEKTDGMGDTLTVRITQRIIWYNGETDTQIDSEDILIQEKSTSAPDGTVNLYY